MKTRKLIKVDVVQLEDVKGSSALPRRLFGRSFISLLGAVVALPLLWADTGFAADEAAIKLLAFGDSLTEGYGLANADDGFTAQLERALEGVEVINAGFAGDTTQGGLDRLAWSLMDQPDAAILQLGANDMLRGFDPASTRENLTALLDEFLAADIPVLLVGMRASPSMGEDFQAQFDVIYPELAAQYAAQNVLFYPFFLDGVVADPTLNQQDGIHPNPEGVEIIVERILPSVNALIATVNAD